LIQPNLAEDKFSIVFDEPYGMNSQTFLIALQLFVSVLAVLIFYKVWKIHLASFALQGAVKSSSDNLYTQIQSYMDLTRILRLDFPLPLLRGWAASPDFLLVIAKHVLDAKPGAVLECSSGASTVVLARMLQQNGKGHVYSLEHDPVFAKKTIDELGRHGLSSWATVITAPLVDLKSIPGHRWYDLSAVPNALGEVDMLVIDGPPDRTCFMARYPAFPELKARLSPSSAIFMDDSNRDHEKQSVDRWLTDDADWTLESLPCEKGCAKLSRLGHEQGPGARAEMTFR
jgi:predicted O-methyltransferase YrrM